MLSNKAKWNQIVYTKKFRLRFHLASGNNSFTKKHKTTPSLGQRKAVRDFLYTVFLTENLLIRSMNCEF